jgi:CheY-like chemotaxis protein
MPGLSGYETFIRLQQVRPGIKVLLSSGYDEANVKQQFIGKQLAGFIQEPYTALALTETVKGILHFQSPPSAHAGRSRQ